LGVLRSIRCARPMRRRLGSGAAFLSQGGDRDSPRSEEFRNSPQPQSFSSAPSSSRVARDHAAQDEFDSRRRAVVERCESGAQRAVCRCNPVQGATASLAFTATLAMWNLQLTESKGDVRVRIPLSPPNFVV
jgi:hypothetical protein